MSDIVKRLEDMFFRFGTESPAYTANRRIQTAKDAADEIEKLRAENEKLRAAFQKYFGQSEATNVRAALGEKGMTIEDYEKELEEQAQKIKKLKEAIYKYVNAVVGHEGVTFLDDIDHEPWAALINKTCEEEHRERYK
jgi:hypothetical protein